MDRICDKCGKLMERAFVYNNSEKGHVFVWTCKKCNIERSEWFDGEKIQVKINIKE